MTSFRQAVDVHANTYSQAIASLYLSTKAFEAVVEMSPDNSDGWKYKSYALEALGRHEEANDAHKKASMIEQPNG